jgi:hypothetical protein
VTPTRVTVGVYVALALNVFYLVVSLGLSTARPTALASDLGDALRRDGYEVPFGLIHQHLKTSQSSQNQLIYVLILPSTAVLVYCATYLHPSSNREESHSLHEPSINS